ncbi:NAD(+) synthase [Geomonas agri]|uniref:NAD(+) synthase n=1 Tax=Geomonas agri TaxID=2873702 RepID=UPI001CD79B6C|nr:NAD(+) synthase [Geomonas agri]
MSRFSASALDIDCECEAQRITAGIRTILRDTLKRRGLLVALSGGIDSSVTAALAVRAIGRDRVYGLEMPELHSAQETPQLSAALIRHLGIGSQRIDISPVLEAAGCYAAYDAALRKVIPGYGEGWRSKIVISGVFDSKGFRLHYIVARAPDGTILKERLPLGPYLEIVAATNCKQRTRKMLEYYHADRLNYAVAGTPNRLEYDQGFFVKLGDGAADLKPIAHLYKSQVFQMAEYLGIPEEIRSRAPTTDTYSLPQGQEEFYFSLPYRTMDLCLCAKNRGVSPEDAAAACGLTPDQVRKVYQDIDIKRSTTRYLHLAGLTVVEIPEVPARPGVPSERFSI